MAASTPTPVTPPAMPPLHPARVAASLGLGGLLLGASLCSQQLYGLLDAGWHAAGARLGLAPRLPGLLQAQGPLAALTYQAGRLPAVALYSGLYLGLCLGVLFLLLPARRARRAVLLFYGGAGLAAGLLLLGSRAGGGPVLAGLANQLVHLLVSPVPVMALVPLLRWPGAARD